MALESDFQCVRVGKPVTAGRLDVGIAGSSGSGSVNCAGVPVPVAFFNLSVERLDNGLTAGWPSASRLSVLPCTLRGGVRGEARCGREVGRRAAGMNMGDLGGRS